jgi:hypothetical protein
MATADDYAIGTKALAVVVAAAIKKNVPESFSWAVKEHQDIIDQFTKDGAKAVIDWVDAERANIAKGLA